MTGEVEHTILAASAAMKSNEKPRVEPREHGLLTEARLHAADVTREAVVDLANIGCRYAAPSDLVEVLREMPLNTYPDPTALQARLAVAAKLGTSPDRILIGNGASALMWLIAGALAKPDSVVLSIMPGPGEFAAAARAL